MRRPCARPIQRAHGFTLVEILIVVVILGVLAALVIPSFSDVRDTTQQGAFISDVRNFANAAEVHTARTGVPIEDTSSGEFPEALAEAFDARDFEGGTPIGGVWDFESFDTGDVASAVGVHFNGDGETRDDDYMLQIDAAFDDGDLETGVFRKLAEARYYYVIED